MTKFFFSFLLLIAVFTVSSQEKLQGQPDLPGDILFDLGFNTWDQEGDTLKLIPSRSLGLYYNKRYKITKKLSFYVAAGVGIEKFAFQGNYFLSRNNIGKIFVDTIFADIRKNKLNITYFDVPLELRFHPKGTIEGEGFFIGAGVIPGFKLEAHTKVRYKTRESDALQTQKFRGNFGLNDFRLGMQVRVGWKGVNFFYKTYFTNLFRNRQDLIDPNFTLTGQDFNPTVSTFGINLSGF